MKYSSIILIDDDHIIRYSFKKLIKEFFPSQTFSIFEHGGQGLDYLNNLDFEKYDKKILILLDINMPQIDGWSFLKKFKEQPLTFKKNITIHILSSTIDRNEIKTILENTLISGHISKPLTLDELRKLIE